MDQVVRTPHLQALLSHTAIGIAACDADGTMSLLSPGLQELLGQPFEPVAEGAMAGHFQLLDESGTVPLAPDQVPLVRANAGEVVHDAVISTVVPDRGLVFLRCNAAPLLGDDGRPAGAVVLVQDITVEHRALAEQDALRRRLFETINHEFRTPLAALLGHTELLRVQAHELPEQLATSLLAIERLGWRLRDLVRTVSDIVDRQEELRRLSTHLDECQERG